MWHLLAALLALASLVVASPLRAQATTATVEDDAFVRVEGARFVLRGEPWHFLGANVAVVHGPRHRAAMEATLDAVRDDGLSVIRVWALGEALSAAPAWAPEYAFRVGEDGWIESSFEHLDRVIAAASARGLRVIVVLANRWADYGGFARYLEWVGERQAGVDPRDLTDLEVSRFYECARCGVLYRAHVARVVGRVNSVTGVAYRDDPTILAWELANELSAVPRDRDALVRWVTENARFVHSLDAHHLVSAGQIGYGGRSDRRTWLDVQRIAEIDYADAHAYPLKSGRVSTLAQLDRWIDDRVQLAHHVAHKPFVWGEFGFSARHRTLLGFPLAAWFDRFIARSHRDGVDGVLVWHYAPRENGADDHAIDADGARAGAAQQVRRLLARQARRWRRSPPVERNVRLGDARGEEPLTPLDQALRGSAAPHADWSPAVDGSWSLSIAPRAFARARFEAVGAWAGPPVAHVWGAGGGEVVYRFRAPRGERSPQRFMLRFRASSELPGAGAGARATDVSIVHVWVGDVELGVLTAPVDDGHGAWLELAIDDPALLARAFGARSGVYELALRVDSEVGASGLCLYEEDVEHPEAPPGRIELTWQTSPGAPR